jgi:hypothetical protein
MNPSARPSSGRRIPNAAFVVIAGFYLLACKDAKPSLPPLEAVAPPAFVPPRGPSVRAFSVERASRTSLVMVAPRETFRGVTTEAEGSIHLDAANLAASRATFRVDLATLSSESFSDPEKNEAQTRHARRWLELTAEGASSLDAVAIHTRRFATFTVRAVPDVSARSLDEAAVEKSGEARVRVIRLSAKGELSIHGCQVERDAKVELRAYYEGSAPIDSPSWLEIRTVEPLRVVLSEHEIKPRDAFGKLVKSAGHLLGTRVAEDAEIHLELRARPQP